MRIILFSGKGGSGATTMAVATAAAIATSGRRTLAFGLNAGLGAALESSLGSEPKAVADELWAVEAERHRDSPDEFRDWMEDLLDWRGMDAGLAEDIAALPGMNHVGCLLELARHTESSAFDVIVVDGSSLVQFLDLPPALDAAARWLDRLFAPRQSNVFEPFLRVFAGDYASTGEDVFEHGRELLSRLAALRDLLTDSAVASVRLVMAADGAATADAQDAVAALSLFSFSTDALIVNRILPDEVKDPFFQPLRSEQQRVLEEVVESFGPIPLLKASLASSAIRGLQPLAGLGHDLYGDSSPADVLHRSPGHSFAQRNGRYVLSLKLPYARREELSLEQTDEGIAVHLNGHRCVFPLPEEVRYREADSWSFEPPELKIVFRA